MTGGLPAWQKSVQLQRVVGWLAWLFDIQCQDWLHLIMTMESQEMDIST